MSKFIEVELPVKRKKERILKKYAIEISSIYNICEVPNEQTIIMCEPFRYPIVVENSYTEVLEKIRRVAEYGEKFYDCQDELYGDIEDEVHTWDRENGADLSDSEFEIEVEKRIETAKIK